MTDQAILFTQCLQNDFVRPAGRYEALPNLLHVGVDEARRLMGEKPEEGPVALVMKWAYGQSADALAIIHIRDWHDPEDAFQKEHLRQFGSHCIGGSEGAEFAFPETDAGRQRHIIESRGLNDFVGTSLQETLAPYAGRKVRVGLMGVWTEAKVSFLAYDLRTRYPDMDLAICSALTASSSRAAHFMALEQLQRILGVRVISSIGEFTKFLGGSSVEVELPVPSHADRPSLSLEGEAKVTETDRKLIRYLFRDCREVSLKVLDGGYSGNLVLGCESVDLHGHQQVPHVVKLGPEEPIGQERAAFEQVEEVLGNNAPTVTDFVDVAGRGGLKYRYAAMGGGFTTTFQKRYMAGLPQDESDRYLKTIFEEQLGRFYRAATFEHTNLLEYYWFSPERAPNVRKRVEELLGGPAEGDTLKLPTGQEFPNLCQFYERDLAEIMPRAVGSRYFSYLHGDLNGANILVDAQDNVWLIDFFHTHHGHILKDLIKLENDLLYIFTPVNNLDDLAHAVRLTDVLTQVGDLALPLAEVEGTGITHPEMQRAYKTLRCLRSFYPDLIKHDRDPLQLFIAQLRYAAHTLAFEESNNLQKLWALYTAGVLGAEITRRLRQRGPLRVDWLESELLKTGRLGITLLPGRGDHGRSLSDDVAALQTAGVSHVVALLTDDELRDYGVEDLFQAYSEAGFVVRRMPILDQAACSRAEMAEVSGWLDKQLATDAKVMIHCVGGLGRAGLVVASYLKTKGLDSDAAIDAVRRARSIRALESPVQEAFVRGFSA